MVKQNIATVNRYRRGASRPNSKPGAKERRRRRAQRLIKEYVDTQSLLYEAIKNGKMPPEMQGYVDDPSAYE